MGNLPPSRGCDSKSRHTHTPQSAWTKVRADGAVVQQHLPGSPSHCNTSECIKRHWSLYHQIFRCTKSPGFVSAAASWAGKMSWMRPVQNWILPKLSQNLKANSPIRVMPSKCSAAPCFVGISRVCGEQTKALRTDLPSAIREVISTFWLLTSGLSQQLWKFS